MSEGYTPMTDKAMKAVKAVYPRISYVEVVDDPLFYLFQDGVEIAALRQGGR